MTKSLVTVLPPFSSSFSKEVDSLASEAKDLQKSYKTLTERMLRFAVRFHDLWKEAHRLDGYKDNGQHTAHFRTVLGKIVNTDNPSIHSRWNTIGKHAKQLLPLVESLPPQRDALYELARATKEGKRVESWIEHDKLSAESSFRDVQALCKKKPRSSRTQKTPSNKVPVTLYFDSYGDAAQCVAEFMTRHDYITLTAHPALKDALREILGKNYEKIARRIK